MRTARGWDENGIPTKETLLINDLPEVVEDLKAHGLFIAPLSGTEVQDSFLK